MVPDMVYRHYVDVQQMILEHVLVKGLIRKRVEHHFLLVALGRCTITDVNMPEVKLLGNSDYLFGQR